MSVYDGVIGGLASWYRPAALPASWLPANVGRVVDGRNSRGLFAAPAVRFGKNYGVIAVETLEG
jgi:hypothetical protein